MSLPATTDELRRLTLVRHLYELAVQQSRGLEPTASLALLHFHDAIEIFLQLGGERHGVGENKPEFIGYWDMFAKKNITLPQKEVMRRLNAARVGLKHKGVLPALVETEGFRAAVTNFFSDATPILFGIPFDRVLLVGLVSSSEVREILEMGFAALQRGDHSEALKAAAVGFILARRVHRPTLDDVTEIPSLARKAAPRPISSILIQEISGSREERVVRALAQRSDEAHSTLTAAVEVIGFGLDLKEYLLFTSCVPHVSQTIDGSLVVDGFIRTDLDCKLVERSLQFALSAALRFEH